MRKVILATALLAAVVAAGIYETMAAWTEFTAMADELQTVAEELSALGEDEVSEGATEKLDVLLDGWIERENIYYIIYDNRVLSDLYERMTTARGYALAGHNADACAQIDGAVFRLRSLARDALPLPLNFL